MVDILHHSFAKYVIPKRVNSQLDEKTDILEIAKLINKGNGYSIYKGDYSSNVFKNNNWRMVPYMVPYMIPYMVPMGPNMVPYMVSYMVPNGPLYLVHMKFTIMLFLCYFLSVIGTP